MKRPINVGGGGASRAGKTDGRKQIPANVKSLRESGWGEIRTREWVCRRLTRHTRRAYARHMRGAREFAQLGAALVPIYGGMRIRVSLVSFTSRWLSPALSRASSRKHSGRTPEVTS